MVSTSHVNLLSLESNIQHDTILIMQHRNGITKTKEIRALQQIIHIRYPTIQKLVVIHIVTNCVKVAISMDARAITS